MLEYSCQEKTAELRDKLTGMLIGLARATDGNEHLISASSTAVVTESLFALLGNDREALERLIQQVEDEKRKMVPSCFTCASPCGRTSDYDLNMLRNAEEDARNLKFLLLSGICGMAAHACHGALQGFHDEAVDRFFYKALIVIGLEEFGKEELLPILTELGELYDRSMILGENT